MGYRWTILIGFRVGLLFDPTTSA